MAFIRRVIDQNRLQRVSKATFQDALALLKSLTPPNSAQAADLENEFNAADPLGKAGMLLQAVQTVSNLRIGPSPVAQHFAFVQPPSVGRMVFESIDPQYVPRNWEGATPKARTEMVWRCSKLLGARAMQVLDDNQAPDAQAALNDMLQIPGLALDDSIRIQRYFGMGSEEVGKLDATSRDRLNRAALVCHTAWLVYFLTCYP
jgi:hypothetical protein